MLDVKKIRKNLKLTQGDLAKKLGVNTRTVQKWESGESNMSGSAVLLLQELENKSEFMGMNKSQIEDEKNNDSLDILKLLLEKIESIECDIENIKTFIKLDEEIKNS